MIQIAKARRGYHDRLIAELMRKHQQNKNNKNMISLKSKTQNPVFAKFKTIVSIILSIKISILEKEAIY